jgi:hypothetical protein
MKFPRQKIGPLPALHEKVVSVTLSGEEWARVLVHPKWEVQAGRLFLVGTVPPGGSTNDWLAGVTDSVAWEFVSAYTVFDSPKEYAKKLAIHNRKNRKS